MGMKRERATTGSPPKTRSCKRSAKRALKQENISPSSQPSVSTNQVLGGMEDDIA